MTNEFLRKVVFSSEVVETKDYLYSTHRGDTMTKIVRTKKDVTDWETVALYDNETDTFEMI